MTTATISIVSHGHGDLLQRLLRDLSIQHSIDHCRIVVTLNLPGEPFDQAAHAGLALTVRRNAVPKGFGANHNAAFSHCDAPLFVILNPDIRLPDTRAISRLVGSGMPSGLLAPSVTNFAGHPEDSVRRNLSPWSLARRALGFDRAPVAQTTTRVGQPFFWVAGMFVVVEADAFRRVNGFDEQFFLYCEDYDLCARLYSAGYTLRITADVKAIHDAQRDSHRSLRHLRWHVTSLLKVWTSAAFWRVTLHLTPSPRRQ